MPIQMPFAFEDLGKGAPRRKNVIRLKSFTAERWHNISTDEKTCDCDEFLTRAGRCKHLDALGIHRLKAIFRPDSPGLLAGAIGPRKIP